MAVADADCSAETMSVTCNPNWNPILLTWKVLYSIDFDRGWDRHVEIQLCSRDCRFCKAQVVCLNLAYYICRYRAMTRLSSMTLPALL